MKRICFYLSDHGFGHIARNIPIIAAALKNNVFIYVVCGEKHIDFAKQNFSATLTAEQYQKIIFRKDKMDIGLILQEGTLLVDSEKLTKACEQYLAVSVTQQDLHDIKKIVRKLDRLDGSYAEFYDCADEIAEKLMSL